MKVEEEQEEEEEECQWKTISPAFSFSVQSTVTCNRSIFELPWIKVR
jgi:hypothetical protein